MKPKILLYLIIPAILLTSYMEHIGQVQVQFLLKPLLLLMIALYYAMSRKGKWTALDTIMIASFLFSISGDVFLSLVPRSAADTQLLGIPKNKYFFLGGVASFFLTQVSFITAFRKAVNPTPSSLNKWWNLPLVIYWLGMLSFVVPALRHNPEKSAATIPVIIYSGTLISMAMFALQRYGRTTTQSFWLTFIGACTFVVSDSLIAINFLVLAQPMATAGFWIIITFMPAELWIATGILQHEQTTVTAIEIR